jgi:hypothetical protein
VVALQASQQAMAALLAPEEATTATPPPSNSVMDTVTPDVDTPPPKKPRRTTRVRGHHVATLTKEGHDSDVEVTSNKPPTKRVRGFKKRKPHVPKKRRMSHMAATQAQKMKTY